MTQEDTLQQRKEINKRLEHLFNEQIRIEQEVEHLETVTDEKLRILIQQQSSVENQIDCLEEEMQEIEEELTTVL